MSPSEPLPEITHLQFLVLTALRDGTRSGRQLRDVLRERGARRSGPAFYQMMSRLEDGGLVAGNYQQRVQDGHGVKERCYSITPPGEDAWKSTRDFYVSTLPAEERELADV